MFLLKEQIGASSSVIRIRAANNCGAPYHIALRPLPFVVVVPERRLYFHNNLDHHYWDYLWYYGERERGPWQKPPREYYPGQYRERDRDWDERQRNEDYRHRDRD